MFRRLKWLQWSETDLASGLGGVEEHARCVNRELRALGVDAYISRDARELENPAWDVIHTHGGGIANPKTSAVKIHTLHGTTLGRMAACREWLWARGYLAEMREIQGVTRADAVLAVHPGLSLFKLANKLGKVTAVCGNGWDSGLDTPGARAPLPAELLSRIDSSRPVWLYVGRGDDFVKGADRVRNLLRTRSSLQLVAVPGTGFEREGTVIRTGRLDSSQVRSLMELAQGLLVPSRYEGNSLVVLEALASGMGVVSTRVGNVPLFPDSIQGLEIIDSGSTSDLNRAIERSEKYISDDLARRKRLENNRTHLPRWEAVARTAITAVERVKKERGKS
jgi:glycosyltransferase involved in cell wall biosynthesis